MNILPTNEDYFNKLHELSDKSDSICLCTYGIYAGIMPDGRDLSRRYQNMVHEFFDSIIDKRVVIVVGLYPFMPCCDNCTDCIESHVKNLLRLLCTAEKWPSFKWMFSETMHAKYCLFSNKNQFNGAIVGSRNLSDSQYADVSFYSDDSKLKNLYAHFRQLCLDSKDVTSDNISPIIDKVDTVGYVDHIMGE